MAIKFFFGLPGCGKTTLLTYHCFNALRSKRYQNVYSNVGLDLNGLILINNDDIGKYHEILKYME